MTRPRLALTLGDPAGIGPEVVARVLSEAEVAGNSDLTVVGPRWALERGFECVGRSDPSVAYELVDTPEVDAWRPSWGQKGPASGAWAMAALETAARLAENGQVDALVTAPVSKAAIHAAGHTTFVGHTEFLGARVGVPRPTMFFWSAQLCVSLVTIHCALRDVPVLLRQEEIHTTIERTAHVLRSLGVERPRIGVCGLNPHAGEDGLFGDEDQSLIAPVVAVARASSFHIEGPLPGDTAFMRAGRGDFDALVAMYHDQGLAPFKLVAFDTGVNVTLGLPYVRTSVDHGTAFDIAGQGRADASSLLSAIHLAARLVHATASSR